MSGPHTPRRTCLGCRRADDQSELWRLVRVGDEVVDATRPRLPGRGAYLHPNQACVTAVVDRRGLQRAFRGQVVPSADLLARLADVGLGWNPTPRRG